MSTRTDTPSRLALLRQLLPPEHGSWAFVAEPLLIGLIVGGFQTNICLVLAAFVAFLAYRPAHIGLGDLARKKRYPRTDLAIAATVLLGTSALVLIWFALPSLAQAIPFVLAGALLAAVFVWIDSIAKPRALIRELLGAVLMIPVAMAAFSHTAWPYAFGLLLAMRALSSVLSVRALFDRQEDTQICRITSLLLAGLSAFFAFEITKHAGYLVLPAYALMAARILWLALTPRIPRRPPMIGVQESLVSVLCVASWLLHA